MSGGGGSINEPSVKRALRSMSACALPNEANSTCSTLPDGATHILTTMDDGAITRPSSSMRCCIQPCKRCTLSSTGSLSHSRIWFPTISAYDNQCAGTPCATAMEEDEAISPRPINPNMRLNIHRHRVRRTRLILSPSRCVMGLLGRCRRTERPPTGWRRERREIDGAPTAARHCW